MRKIVCVILILFFFCIGYAQNKNYGYVVSSDYDEIEKVNGMAILLKNNKMGAATGNGKILFPCIYSFAYYFPKSKTFIVKDGGSNWKNWDDSSKGGKWGMIDKNGNALTEIKYTMLYAFEDIDYQFVNVGGKIVGKITDDNINITGGKWGLMYKSGKEIIPCIYDGIGCSTSNYNIVHVNIGGKQSFDGNFRGGKWGMMDKDGNMLTPIKYAHLYNFGEDEYQLVNEGEMDNNGIIKGGKWGVLHKSGKEILSCKYDAIIEHENGNFYLVKNNEKWGYVNLKEQISMPVKYDNIQYFDSQDFLIVSETLNDRIKMGILNKNGIEILPCQYDFIRDATENIFTLKKDGKWGYADISGNIIVPLEYDYADSFDKGVARVTKDGQTTLIKNPLKEGNSIVLAQSSDATKDLNAPAVSRYPAPNSDVDKDIPQSNAKNENLFAFIIANENYPEAPVPFALNDGRVFKEYCLKTLGLPDNNIKMFEDASLGRIIAAVEQIKEIADVYDGEAEVIIYYAGHGVPDDQRNTAYLLPVDGNGSDITTTGYSLEKFYSELSKLNLKSVTVFLDACFSGAKREDEMLTSARGIAIKVKEEAPRGNMVVFSAATGDETAHQYEEKGHGLFTYFLLKKLQETQGEVTYGELSDYLNRQVKRQSVVINNKRQTPTVIPSASLTNWERLKLK